jgi:hypothetical protein
MIPILSLVFLIELVSMIYYTKTRSCHH